MDRFTLADGRGVIFLAAILGLLSLGLIYGKPLNSPPIRSDGLGYYLYLPAAIIDRDLSLKSTVERVFDGRPPDFAGVSRVPGTTRLLIKYPLGEAILMAPFFLAAHAAATLFGVAAADGFSRPYQVAAALAGCSYLLLGLVTLRRLLLRAFSPGVVSWTLAVMVFATNLFHYGTYDDVFSHAFSFCLFCWFLRAVERWYSRPAVGSMLVLSCVAGLITLVRPTNSLVFVYAILFGIGDRVTMPDRLRFVWRHADTVLMGVLVYVTVLMPQLAYWKFVTGHWVVFSYGDESFNFARPQLLNVLFSVRKGLFFWSPALLIAVAGLIWLRRYAAAYVLPTLLFLPINAFVIASWHDWAYGGSFGHRAFVESIPVFALGYGSWLQTMVSAGWRRTALAISTVLMLLSADLMLKYWMGLLPYDRTTWPQFVHALRVWA